VILWAGLLGCGPPPTEAPAPGVRLCNGEPQLCDRPLDEVVFTKTHNSHATEERGYARAAMNHYGAIPTQLADGVRALNVDVYPWDEQTEPTTDPNPPLWLCHGFCVLGNQLFSEALEEVATFMDTHPDAVITLELQVEADRQQIAAEMEASGLTDLAIPHIRGEPWPTLGALIDADQRILFVSGSADGPEWWLPDEDVFFSTDWGTRTVEDFRCDLNREPFPGALFQLDHTLSNKITSPELAATANTASVLQARIEECGQSAGQRPNWISVDYYSIGDVAAVVAELNDQ